MHIHEHVGDNQVVVFEVDGKIVLSEADAEVFRSAVRGALERGYTRMVVDLGRVRVLNTAGLGVLIGALKTVRENGGDIKLARTTRGLSRILMVTDLIKVFATFETVDQAIASYQ